MRYEVPIGGGADWIGYEFLPDHIRGVRDLFIQHGTATDEDMDLEALAVRVRDEVVNATACSAQCQRDGWSTFSR